jgi:hypothetical protein
VGPQFHSIPAAAAEISHSFFFASLKKNATQVAAPLYIFFRHCTCACVDEPEGRVCVDGIVLQQQLAGSNNNTHTRLPLEPQRQWPLQWQTKRERAETG